MRENFRREIRHEKVAQIALLLSTYNLQSVILSVAPLTALSVTTGGPASTCLRSKLVITQFLFHFSSKNTSQLINGIFSALQKLPKYFNGLANSIFCVPFLFTS